MFKLEISKFLESPAAFVQEVYDAERAFQYKKMWLLSWDLFDLIELSRAECSRAEQAKQTELFVATETSMMAKAATLVGDLLSRLDPARLTDLGISGALSAFKPWCKHTPEYASFATRATEVAAVRGDKDLQLLVSRFAALA
jgi:hypothetical protein